MSLRATVMSGLDLAPAKGLEMFILNINGVSIIPEEYTHIAFLCWAPQEWSLNLD
jgi:hypothetical protein